MKIFNVMFTTHLGGLEQSFLDYNEVFKMSDIEVISIVHSSSPLIPIIDNKIYKVFNLSKYDFIALFKLQKLVKKEKPDIIITHGNRAHYMMNKITGATLVVGILHGFSFDYIKNCDYIISVSRAAREKLIEEGYQPYRSLHIPNVIKLPENIKFNELCTYDIPTIGMIARIDKNKGIDIFIKALSLLKEQNFKFQAMIAGDGDEYQNMKKLIVHYELQENIKMLGWISDKKDFYEQIDILVVPSRSESFGIVILEGFAHSKPVIVSNASGPMEIVENDIDALVFENENYIELSNHLKKLFYNKELARNLACNGFNKVKSYDIAVVSKKIVNFLSTLYHKKFTSQT